MPTDRELEAALLVQEIAATDAVEAARELAGTLAAERECRERQKQTFREELQNAVETAQELIDALTVAMAAVDMV